MKEITKRARRREARQSNANAKKLSVKPESGSVNSALLMTTTTGITRHAAAISGVVSPIPFNSFGTSLISTGPSLGTRSACATSSSGNVFPSLLRGGSSNEGSLVHRSSGYNSNLTHAGHGFSHSGTPSTRSVSSNSFACSSTEPAARSDRRSTSSTTCTSCCWRTKLCSPRTRQCYYGSTEVVRKTEYGDDDDGMDNDSGFSLESCSKATESTHPRGTWTAPVEGATLTRAAARKSEAIGTW